jgi:hypothetical protein
MVYRHLCCRLLISFSYVYLFHYLLSVSLLTDDLRAECSDELVLYCALSRADGYYFGEVVKIFIRVIIQIYIWH